MKSSRRAKRSARTKKQTWFYGRFSTAPQMMGTSTGEYSAACRSVRTARGMPQAAAGRLYFDSAEAGQHPSRRAGLHRLLVDAAGPGPRGGVVLVVQSMDRLARNIGEYSDLIKRLSGDAGFRIVTADGPDSSKGINSSRRTKGREKF
jgi:DNA invertase Pin-like site-specific DNA recombinase